MCAPTHVLSLSTSKQAEEVVCGLQPLSAPGVLFFYTPTASAASPRNTIIGHAVGAIAGYLSLEVTGLTLLYRLE